MKRTGPVALVLCAASGAIVAGLVQVGLAASGRPVIVAPLTLALALVLIGVIVIALAVPIKRMTRGSTAGPVDPFYATRVVMLAKASSISGALVLGVAIGLLGYLLSRSVIPGVPSITSAVAALVGAAALMTCGLVAEAMCRIPPRDDDDDDDQKPIRVGS